MKWQKPTPEVAAEVDKLPKAGDRKGAKMHLTVHGLLPPKDAEMWIEVHEPINLAEYFASHERSVECLAIGFMLNEYPKNDLEKWRGEVIDSLKSRMAPGSHELAAKRAEAILLGKAYDYVYGDDFEEKYGK
jgi:hypothetical protein